MATLLETLLETSEIKCPRECVCVCVFICLSVYISWVGAGAAARSLSPGERRMDPRAAGTARGDPGVAAALTGPKAL